MVFVLLVGQLWLAPGFPVIISQGRQCSLAKNALAY